MIDDQRNENMTASFVTTITTAGMLLIGAAVSAFACDNFIGTATRGIGNSTVAETWGNHYVSTDQDGDGNGVRARIQGHCNGYVAGQYGDENGAKANIAGAYNGVAMLQNGDDARAGANVAGNGNGIFSSQSRSGSRASFDIAGSGNRVVSIQH
jgi:hypothetical protein